MFDDVARSLIKEPFIEGADDIIEYLLEQGSISEAEKNGLLFFISPKAFPKAHAKLTLSTKTVTKSNEGFYYDFNPGEVPMEGWLCPALNLFFEDPPETLFIKFKSLPASQKT